MGESAQNARRMPRGETLKKHDVVVRCSKEWKHLSMTIFSPCRKTRKPLPSVFAVEEAVELLVIVQMDERPLILIKFYFPK